MEYISWSRGLINAHRKFQSSFSPITTTFTTTTIILHLTHLTFQNYPPTSPGYIGWSRDLCKLLRAQNRELEALDVEIRVWEEMKREMVARPGDKGAAFRARGPGLVVAGSYRRLGRVELAVGVEKECGEGDGRFRGVGSMRV